MPEYEPCKCGKTGYKTYGSSVLCNFCTTIMQPKTAVADKIIAEREMQYGSFKDMSDLAQGIKKCNAE